MVRLVRRGRLPAGQQRLRRVPGGAVALEGLLVAIVMLMSLYLAARTSRGLVTRPRNNSFDLVTLFMTYTAVQGLITNLIVRLFPGTV